MRGERWELVAGLAAVSWSPGPKPNHAERERAGDRCSVGVGSRCLTRVVVAVAAAGGGTRCLRSSSVSAPPLSPLILYLRVPACLCRCVCVCVCVCGLQVEDIVRRGVMEGVNADNISMEVNGRKFAHDKVLSLLALLVQKYNY